MPTAPYAKILVRVNGGSPQSGGITVAEGDVVHLQAESTVAWPQFPAPRWEIYDVPDGWPAPSGWTDDTNGTYLYDGTSPPDFTIPDASFWWKFPLRLTVAGGHVDEETMLSLPSPNGLEDIAFNESNQFDVKRAWLGALKKSLRSVDSAVSTAVGSTSLTKAPVRAATTANLADLSNCSNVFDGITCAANDRVLVKDQDDASENGVYKLGAVVAGMTSLTRTSDFDSDAEAVQGAQVYVRSGATQRGLTYELSESGAVVLDTTPLRFLRRDHELDARIYASADGSTDDLTAVQSAVAATDVLRLTPGSGGYKIGTTGTLGGAGKTLKVDPGAKLVVPSGVTLTVDWETIDAPDQEIFEVQSGGTIVWGSNAPREVRAAWLGADGRGGGHDDAPGIVRAATLALLTGIKVMLPGRQLTLLTPVVIGTAGGVNGHHGLTIEAPHPTYSTAHLVVGTSFGAGRAAMTIQNIARVQLNNVSIDANGLADYLLLHRNDQTGGNPSWHHELRDVTLRNGRIAWHVRGDYVLAPTLDAGTDTFSATDHPLQDDDRVDLVRVHKSTTLPATSGGTLGTRYWVVNATADTFQLSLTQGGAAEDFTTAGIGKWLAVRVVSADSTATQVSADCSVSYEIGTQYGNITVPGIEPVAHLIAFGQESFGHFMSGCWFQGASAGSKTFTADATANTLTCTGLAPSAGDRIRVWSDGGAVPGGLARDTDYYVLAPSGDTFQVEAAPGYGAIDLTTTGTGTLRLLRFSFPTHGIVALEGEVDVYASTFTALDADVLYEPLRHSQGATVSVRDCTSQSWRILESRQTSGTPTAQIGGVVLAGCRATGGANGNGAQNAIEWDTNTTAQLTVEGGAYYRDIFIGSANGGARAALIAPAFVLDGLVVPAVTGTLTYVSHVSTDHATRIAGNLQIGNGNGIVAIDAASLPIGVSTGAAWAVTRSGTDSYFYLGSGQSNAIFDASSGANGALTLKAKAGTSAGQGIIAEADLLSLTDAAGTERAKVTYPSNVPTVTAPASWEYSVTGHWSATASVYALVKGGDFYEDATTHHVRNSSSQDRLTFDFPANFSRLQSVNGIELTCATAEKLACEADTISFRSAAASEKMTLTYPSSVPTFTSGGSMTWTITSAANFTAATWAAVTTTYGNLRGPDLYLDATTFNIRNASTAAEGTISSPGGVLTFTSVSGMAVTSTTTLAVTAGTSAVYDCGNTYTTEIRVNGTARLVAAGAYVQAKAADTYGDTDTFHFRNAASQDRATVSYGGGSTTTFLALAALVLDCGNGSTTKLAHNGTTRVQVGTTGIALFGGTERAQPARAGQLTDNSGGTSGGNTIAAIGGAVDPTAALKADTANAIATLAAKINAIEDKLSGAGTGIGVTA